MIYTQRKEEAAAQAAIIQQKLLTDAQHAMALARQEASIAFKAMKLEI
jgi:hypothetical protein